MPFVRCNTLRGNNCLSNRNKPNPIETVPKSSPIKEQITQSVISQQINNEDREEKEKKLAWYRDRLAQNSKTVIDLQLEHEKYIKECNEEMERLKTIIDASSKKVQREPDAELVALLESKQAQLNALESASPTIKDISLSTPRGDASVSKSQSAVSDKIKIKKKNSTANGTGQNPNVTLSERWK